MHMKTVFWILGLVLFAGAGHYCHATSIPDPFNVSVEALTPLEKNIPVTFKVTFALDTMLYRHPSIGDFGSVSVSLFPFRDRGDTLYHEFWLVQYDDTYSHSITFPLTIPDNNVLVPGAPQLAVGDVRVARSFAPGL